MTIIFKVANTVEHFKFWKDNKGKIDSKRFTYNGLTNFSDSHLWTDENSGVSNYTFEQAHRLTLLEECSDALHFILSLANQVDYKIVGIGKHFEISKDRDSLEKNFLFLNHVIGLREFKHFRSDLEMIIDVFFIYINQLGVSQQELEQAYYDKNKINYERLENGY